MYQPRKMVRWTFRELIKFLFVGMYPIVPRCFRQTRPGCFYFEWLVTCRLYPPSRGTTISKNGKHKKVSPTEFSSIA